MQRRIFNNKKLENIDVVILCGGRGMRLKEVVHDRPKPMAEVSHRPFLDILIEHTSRCGFKRFILCTGYMGHIIRDHYSKMTTPLEIIYSEERGPLGTGGALKRAESFIKTKTFLVMNGDSFCAIDFSEFLDFHLDKNALCSIALTKIKQGQNCGKVRLEEDQQITIFKEKFVLEDKEYSSVGLYLMEKPIFSLMDNKDKFSLEYDFFPDLIEHGCYGYITEEDLIDIGTPEEYKKAQEIFSKFNREL